MPADKYTVEQVLEAVRKNKGILSLAARDLGCTRQTVHNYVRRYATLAAEVASQRDALLDMTEAKLFEQVNRGNITAIIFTLKTLGKSRGYIERQEVTGADGGPIEVSANVESVMRKLLPELADGGTPGTPEPPQEE